MPLFGSHVSCQGGYHRAVARASELGCDCVQIFVSNPPRQWPVVAAKTTAGSGKTARRDENVSVVGGGWEAKPMPEGAVAKWTAAIDASSLQAPIAHASYLINLASPDESLYRKSLEALVAELEKCEALGLEGLVLHPGAFTSSCEEEGLGRVAEALIELFDRVEPGTCRLLLENTAGQGSCLGHSVGQLAAVWNAVAAPARLGICLDTCHAFAAGYEINTARGLRRLKKEVRDQLPKGCVRALHLNDSKKPLGSRVDRHEHIGRGEIGLEGFRLVLADPLFRNVPGYLETEKGTDETTGEAWDRINLEVLRSLI